MGTDSGSRGLTWATAATTSRHPIHYRNQLLLLHAFIKIILVPCDSMSDACDMSFKVLAEHEAERCTLQPSLGLPMVDS